MPDFADILAEVERQRIDDATRRARWRRAMLDRPLIDAAPCENIPTDFARKAYDEIRARPPALTLDGITRDIEAARGSRSALRRLRRRLARTLHPDGGRSTSDADLLARCNALIDDALKEAGR